MPNNKVKNTDGRIIDILIDQPGAITDYDRLLNGRAPVALEQDGIPKGQSDIINFILPSGSSIVPNGPVMDVTIGGIENQFIFRPGGVAQGNVYPSFVSLISAHNATDGPKVIFFDGSLASLDIPLGTYDFSNTLLARFIGPDYPILSGDPTYVNCSIGTIFTGDRLFLNGITLRSLSTSQIMTFPILGGVIILQEGAEIEAAGANVFAKKTGGLGATPLRVIMMNSKLISGANSIFKIDTGDGEIDFYLFGASVIEDDTLETTAAPDIIKYFIYDTSVLASTIQTAVVTPVLVELKAKASLSFYDNTIVSILVSTNVQDAIDELAGMSGSSGFQNQFIFRPGGVASGNIYTSFPTLITAHNLIDGPRIIYFDDSLASITIPAATYDFSNTLLTRFDGPEYSHIGSVGDEVVVALANGTIFSGNKLFAKGITLRSNSATPVMTFPITGLGKIVLQEGAAIRTDNGSAFFYQTGDPGFPVLTVVMADSKIKNTSYPVFEVGGGLNAEIDFHLFGSSIIEYDTLKTADIADVISYFIYDTSVEADLSQTDLISPVVKTLEEKATLSFFDNTVTGTLAAENVQDAIDEITGLVSAGTLFPKKDTFVPAALQTAFVLAFTPNVLSTFLLTVNGVEQREGVNYTVVGTALTWLDVPFTLSTTDLLIIHYFI